MKDNLNNFDSKSDVDIFLNYYFFDKTYRVHSNITFYLEKQMYILFKKTQNVKIIEILDDIYMKVIQKQS